MPLRLAITFLWSILFAAHVRAQTVDPYSYDKIAGFANYLVAQKEFYRAYQEFYRLYIYYPARYSYDSFFIASLYCQYQGKQYQLIRERVGYNSLLKPPLWVFAFDAAFSNIAQDLAHIVLHAPTIESSNPEYETMVLKRKLAYSLLEGDNYNELSPYTALTKEFDLQRIYQYSTFTRDNLKNPYAALGWGILPGAGYIYSDNTENGIIAAIVIGVCAVVTYFAVDSGNSGIAFVTGAAGTFFYGGSILGGYLAAKKTNNQITKELRAYLEEELKFEQDREIIFNRYGKPKTQ
ncbi:MAG: hypothetical protein WBK20_08400 [Spirochaetota bacterium]